MMYLSILNGTQAGNFIELKKGATISMASSLGSDIYLLLDNSDFEATFTINEHDKLVIKSSSKELIADGLPLEIDTPYATPFLFSVEGVNCAISNNPYIQIEDFAITSLPEYQKIDGEINNEEPDLEELSNLGIKPFDESATQKPDFLNRLFERINNNKVIKQITLRLDKFHNSKTGKLLQKYYLQMKVILANLILKLYQKLGYWLYAIFAGIITIFIVSGIIIHQLQQQEEAEITIHEHQVMKTLLNQQLLKLPNRYANLKISSKADSYQLNGVVASTADINYLTKSFKKIDSNIKFNLELFTKIQPQILSILGQHKIIRPQVEFESDSGTLKIRGITNSMEIIDDTEIAISNQYPNLGKIDSSTVFLASDIDTSITNMTSTPAYKDHLEIKKNYAAGIVTIEGYLSTSDINELSNLVKQFNQKYAPEISITLEVQDLVKALPFTIREVYSGSPSYIITGDGQRIYQGGSYKSITIASISKDRIVFQGKFTLSLSLNQLLPVEGSANSASNRAAPDYNDTKEQILDDERANESQTINKQQAQLEALQLVLEKTSDPQLKSSLQETIQNLENDLNYRKREYQYYFKDSK